MKKAKTKVKDKSESLTDKLNQFAEQSEANQTDSVELQTADSLTTKDDKEKECQEEISDAVKTLFNKYENEEFIPQNGLVENGLHHEIYLGDPRKVAPDKLRTILRQPVKRR